MKITLAIRARVARVERMEENNVKLSVSLPAHQAEWMQKYSEQDGMKIPISRIIAKAISDLQAKTQKGE